MASGIVRVRLRAPNDDDDNHDDFAQHGGHTPDNRLTETGAALVNLKTGPGCSEAC